MRLAVHVGGLGGEREGVYRVLARKYKGKIPI